MTPEQWKAELEAALVRAMRYEREKREAILDLLEREAELDAE